MSDREQKIRERAHALWKSEGEPHGRDEDHWHRAAQEVDRETGTPGTAAPGEAPAAPAARKPAAKPRKAAAAPSAPTESAEKTPKRSRTPKASKL